jgi:hypothetical protein
MGTLRALKTAKVPDDKVELIANQNMPRPGLALSAIEKALGHSFKGKLPYDENQNTALGQGAPLLLSQPDSPLAVAIKSSRGTLILHCGEVGGHCYSPDPATPPAQ